MITTSKFDQYDRYLADVHLRIDETECARLTSHAPDHQGWLHLNNALRADGHAQRMDSGAAAEFVP